MKSAVSLISRDGSGNYKYVHPAKSLQPWAHGPDAASELQSMAAVYCIFSGLQIKLSSRLILRVKAGVESITAEYGHIDILVHNAGVPCVAPVAEMPISFVETAFKTNVFGPVVLINAVVPHMVARGKGRIVNIGSVVSLCYGPWAGGYVASKAALEALTDALRLELRPFGIDVVLIMPGAITSNFGDVSLSRIRSDVLQGLKMFKPYEEDLFIRAFTSQGPKSTPTLEFAKKVVAQIMVKSPPAHYAYGRHTTLFSILFYTPFWLRQWFSKIDQKKVASLTMKTD